MKHFITIAALLISFHSQAVGGREGSAGGTPQSGDPDRALQEEYNDPAGVGQGADTDPGGEWRDERQEAYRGNQDQEVLQEDGSVSYPAASGTQETKPLLRDKRNLRFIPSERTLPEEAGPKGKQAQEAVEDGKLPAELDLDNDEINRKQRGE